MSGYVYLYCIGADGLPAVKIGIAQDTKKRLSQLQTGHPSRMSVLWEKKFSSRRAASSAEKFVHNELSGARVGGEWFSVTAEVALEAAERFAPTTARCAPTGRSVRHNPEPPRKIYGFIHPDDDGSRPTRPESDPRWIRRARMSTDERRVLWTHCGLGDPPDGYDDWFIFGGRTPMGAWPIKFGPLPEAAP